MNRSMSHQFVKSVKNAGVQKMKFAFTKSCSICGEKFHSSSKFSLFCNECKTHSERYRFADWLYA